VLVYLQYLLPKYGLTVLVHRLSRVRVPAVKDFLITQFVRLYHVDVDEVHGSVPGDFATLNEFFVRELKADAAPFYRRSMDRSARPARCTAAISSRPKA
jgi:phosphatidylserine decarboxylase